MPAEQGPLDARLAAWMAVVSYYWQRRGLTEQDRARLRADLERDLRLAIAEGASVEDLTDADPSEFAREVAEADGLRMGPLRSDPPLTTTSLITTALLGAVLGAALSALLVYAPGIRLLDQLPLSYAGEGVFAVGLHVLAAILCTVAAMGAVHRRFRQQDGIRRTTALIGLFLLVGGAASVAPTMALAAWLGYSSQAPVVLLELGVVVTFCVAGLRTARWISTRTSATSAGA